MNRHFCFCILSISASISYRLTATSAPRDVVTRPRCAKDNDKTASDCNGECCSGEWLITELRDVKCSDGESCDRKNSNDEACDGECRDRKWSDG